VQRARQGDVEAQFSQGCRLLVSDAADSSGAAGRSPKVEVGLARGTRMHLPVTRDASMVTSPPFDAGAN